MKLFMPRQCWRTVVLPRLIRGLPWVAVVLALLNLPTIALAAPWPAKLLHRLIAPFRSNAFLQDRATPCGLGFADCLLPSQPKPASPAGIDDPTRVVFLQLRGSYCGPFAHHWLEVESSRGTMTLGFGPATVPFIDAGQVSLQDSYGNVERISGMHPLLVLSLPPLNYRYAKAPGSGHAIGNPIPLTVTQADTLIQKIRSRKFIGPYIPIFHDCRSFVCSVQAAAQGSSSLPCYALFKGYW
jgi:hypothetical protein